MIDECKSQYKRAKIGLVFIVLACIVMYFGSDLHYGYLRNYSTISPIVVFSLGMYGTYLISRYIKCIVNYNSKF